MTFVDTNILLYAVSGAPVDADKKAIARSILRGEHLALSVQVLQEFYVQATRSTRPDPLSHQEAADLIRLWLRFSIVDLTVHLLQNALDIKSRCQTSYWDAAILAAAAQAGCTHLLSEDLNPSQSYHGVRVVNPFP